MTTLTPGETQSLVICLILVAAIAAAELFLIMVLTKLHERRHPARFWAFMEGAWERIARGTTATAETILGTTIITMGFLAALTPAGRRRQREVEAAYAAKLAAKLAAERDARFHRPASYFGGQW